MSCFYLLKARVLISKAETVWHRTWRVLRSYRAISSMSNFSVRILQSWWSMIEDTLGAFRCLWLLWKTITNVSSAWEVWIVSLISDVNVWAAVFSLISHRVVSTTWYLTLSSSQESSTACHTISIVLSLSLMLSTLLFTPILTSIRVVIVDIMTTIVS